MHPKQHRQNDAAREILGDAAMQPSRATGARQTMRDHRRAGVNIAPSTTLNRKGRRASWKAVREGKAK